MAAGADDRLGHELVEAHVLGRRRRLAVAGQRDEVGDEVAELLGLLDDVVEQRAAVGLAHRRRVAQDLDVRAQRGHRRAQLVRGVGHELALLGLRGLQAREHPVEARGHAPDLVVAVRVDAPAQVAGRLDVLGRLGQLGHRGDDAAREEPAHAGRERGADGHQRDEHAPQALQHAVGVLERARHLHGADGPERGGQHAQVKAVDAVIGEAAAGVAVGRREGLPRHRAAPGRPRGRAGSRCRWGARAGRSRRARRGWAAASARPGARAAAPAGARREALVEGRVAAQGVVDLAALLAAHRRVGDERREHERDAHDERRHQREPRAQRHDQPSRRT